MAFHQTLDIEGYKASWSTAMFSLNCRMITDTPLRIWGKTMQISTVLVYWWFDHLNVCQRGILTPYHLPECTQICLSPYVTLKHIQTWTVHLLCKKVKYVHLVNYSQSNCMILLAIIFFSFDFFFFFATFLLWLSVLIKNWTTMRKDRI